MDKPLSDAKVIFNQTQGRGFREKINPEAEKDGWARSIFISFPPRVQDELSSQAHSSSTPFTFEMNLQLSGRRRGR